jgi:hypothetical protein
MLGPAKKFVTIKATVRVAWVTECVSDPAMNFADKIADKLAGTRRDKTGLQIQTACPRIYGTVRRQIWRDGWGCRVMNPSLGTTIDNAQGPPIRNPPPRTHHEIHSGRAQRGLIPAVGGMGVSPSFLLHPPIPCHPCPHLHPGPTAKPPRLSTPTYRGRRGDGFRDSL